MTDTPENNKSPTDLPQQDHGAEAPIRERTIMEDTNRRVKVPKHYPHTSASQELQKDETLYYGTIGLQQSPGLERYTSNETQVSDSQLIGASTSLNELQTTSDSQGLQQIEVAIPGGPDSNGIENRLQKGQSGDFSSVSSSNVNDTQSITTPDQRQVNDRSESKESDAHEEIKNSPKQLKHICKEEKKEQTLQTDFSVSDSTKICNGFTPRDDENLGGRESESCQNLAFGQDEQAF